MWAPLIIMALLTTGSLVGHRSRCHVTHAWITCVQSDPSIGWICTPGQSWPMTFTTCDAR